MLVPLGVFWLPQIFASVAQPVLDTPFKWNHVIFHCQCLSNGVNFQVHPPAVGISVRFFSWLYNVPLGGQSAAQLSVYLVAGICWPFCGS